MNSFQPFFFYFRTVTFRAFPQSSSSGWDVYNVKDEFKRQEVCYMSNTFHVLFKTLAGVLYLIKHELRVLYMASKTIHFIPILSVCLRKNFQYKCCISPKNRGNCFVKIYVCFITYKDSFTAMISFVFCSRIINELLKTYIGHQ